MNELILDKKTYVSSKRAAEITGYAKDYIGQMCREGRIEARLVGRNWYVLKSGLEEHRFSADLPKKETKVYPERQFASGDWDQPHYEIESFTDLPSVNRLSDPIPTLIKAEESVEETSGPILSTIEAMQDAWKGWFTQEVQEPEEGSPVLFSKIEDNSTEIDEEAPEEPISDETPVAIRSIGNGSHEHEALNLRRIREYEPEGDSPEVLTTIVSERIVVRKPRYAALNFAFVLIALVAIGVGYIGLGFVNQSLISYKPLSLIAGVSYYNK